MFMKTFKFIKNIFIDTLILLKKNIRDLIQTIFAIITSTFVITIIFILMMEINKLLANLFSNNIDKTSIILMVIEIFIFIGIYDGFFENIFNNIEKCIKYLKNKWNEIK